MPLVNGIDAITLFVDDLDASKAFYRTAFDLPVVFEDEASAVFNFESSVINLLKRSGVPELIDLRRLRRGMPDHGSSSRLESRTLTRPAPSSPLGESHS